MKYSIEVLDIKFDFNENELPYDRYQSKINHNSIH